MRTPLRIGLICFLLLNGCNTAHTFQAPAYGDPETPQITNVDWYFDATASVKGFVRPDRTTTFVDFTRVLEGRLHSLYAPPSVSYNLHRFGMTSEPFTDLRQTWTPAFYVTRRGFEDTDLTVVAREMNPKGISIIMTDLFQSDDHIESFRTMLLNKGLGKRFQFGVIAFRAEFDGTIFDVPPAKSSVQFRGLRPAYAILLGPAPQLRELIDQMLKHQSDVGVELVAALLSTDVGTPSTAFSDLREQQTASEFFLAQNFDDSHDLIAGGPRSFARQLRLGRSAPSPAIEFYTEVLFQPFEVLPQSDSWRIEHVVHMCNVEPPSLVDRLWKRNSGTKNKEDGGAVADPCPVTNRDFDIVYGEPSVSWNTAKKDRIGARVSLNLGKRGDTIRGVKARPDKIYVVNLTVYAEGAGFKLPDWVSQFSQNERESFQGSKTPNLAQFLSAMEESAVKARRPVAMDSYIYIDSK